MDPRARVDGGGAGLPWTGAFLTIAAGLAAGLANGCGGGADPATPEASQGPPRAASGPRAVDGGEGTGASATAQDPGSALRESPELLDWHHEGIGRRMADLEFTGPDREVGHLSDFADAKALAIVFREFDCPVSKRIGHETRRLEEEFAARGVAFLFVSTGVLESVEGIEKDVEAFGFEGRWAVDHDDALTKALRARTTTDTFVLDRTRTLAYRGALSDRVGRGYHRDEARYEYLRDALGAVLADREVDVKATSAPGCFLGVEFPGEDLVFEPGEVTWHDEVSRIVQQRCTTCHYDGGIGPFRLQEMRDLTKRKGMIEFVVEERTMPPWLTTDDTGPWRNDLRLSPWQRAALLAWLEDDCPEGDPADAPVPFKVGSEWTIGEPDIVFPAAQEQVVPPEGDGSYRWIATTRKVPEDLWIQAIEVKSSAPQVVHHVIAEVVWPDGVEAPYHENHLDENMVPDRYKRAHEEKLRAAGITADSSDSRFFFLSAPGNPNVIYPPGVAAFVPKGSEFILQVHYTPSGVETTDLSSMGFVLADGPPDYVAVSRKPAKIDIDLPPNAPHVEYDFTYEFENDVLLYSMAPHMHLRGVSCTIDLISPEGEVERVMDIPEWDLDWNIRYAFLNGRRVRAGSKLRMTALFDNSSGNPENPDPSARVRYGPLTKDEMLLVIVDTIEPLRPR